jgi:hypothetical protein
MFKTQTKLRAERHRTRTENEGQWSKDVRQYIGRMEFYDNATDDRIKVCISSLALICECSNVQHLGYLPTRIRVDAGQAICD